MWYGQQKAKRIFTPDVWNYSRTKQYPQAFWLCTIVWRVYQSFILFFAGLLYRVRYCSMTRGDRKINTNLHFHTKKRHAGSCPYIIWTASVDLNWGTRIFQYSFCFFKELDSWLHHHFQENEKVKNSLISSLYFTRMLIIFQPLRTKVKYKERILPRCNPVQ